jgi:PIN domain nuclease of toxin-antitoxin system
VADRAAVADTHALLYYAAGGGKLGPRAAAHFASAEDGRALVFVPMAVAMEIAFLARAGRSGLRVRPVEFFHRLFLNAAFQPMDLNIDQVVAADDLRFNRDPYDALVVVAAQSLDVPLMTRDTAIIESGAVKVLW